MMRSQHGVYLVLLVTDENGEQIPTGDTEVKAGYKIVFIVKSSRSDEIIKMFGGN